MGSKYTKLDVVDWLHRWKLARVELKKALQQLQITVVGESVEESTLSRAAISRTLSL